MLKRFLPVLLLFAAASARPTDQAPTNVFPSKTWTKAAPEQSGWSVARLQEARKFFDTLPPANLVVADRGRVVVEWGDPAMKIMVSSMRKSILSVLYGIDLPGSKLDLDTTVGQLGIDDDPSLTEEEKKATVRMLLEARSGVYHSCVLGCSLRRSPTKNTNAGIEEERRTSSPTYESFGNPVGGELLFCFGVTM